MKIKIFFFVCIYIFICNDLVAQDFQWATHAGSYSNGSQGFGVACDQSGNSYYTGFFEDSTLFPPYYVKSAGQEDIFVAKYDENGNVLWVKKSGGSGTDFGEGIHISKDGSVYTCGNFYGNADFDTANIQSNFYPDMFLAKYSSDGDFYWVKQGGGDGEASAYSVCNDSKGNVYAAGKFQYDATFDTITVTSLGSCDLFLAKYFPDGELQWLFTGGGTLIDEVISITVDSKDNIYLTGRYSNYAIIGDSAIATVGSYDVFIAKIDSTGNMKWITTLGSIGDDEGMEIIAANDQIYLTGYYNGILHFNADSLPYNGFTNVFTTRIDTSGTILWCKASDSPQNSMSYGLATDIFGNTYVSGGFKDEIVFYPDTLTGFGGWDIFLSAYDSLGNVISAEVLGGPSFDMSRCLTADSAGSLYITGFIKETAMIGSIPVTSYSVIYSDILVAKKNNTITHQSDQPKTFFPVTIVPNPASNKIFLQTPGNIIDQYSKLTATDILGRMIKLNIKNDFSVDVSGLPNGIFLLSSDKNFLGKIVIIRP